MDSGALSDVLEAIRVKDTIADMDDRPRFRRVYGTDIDPEYSRDSEWHELIARHKIKQRLLEAKNRRKSKIRDMEKLIDNNQGSSNISSSSKAVKTSKDDLLAEYRAMKGNSVNLKPKPPEENDVDSIKEDNDSVHRGGYKENENEGTMRPATESVSPKSTLVVSAIIETIEVGGNDRKPAFDDLENKWKDDQALQSTGDHDVQNGETDKVCKESSNLAGKEDINREKNDKTHINDLHESSNNDNRGGSGQEDGGKPELERLHSFSDEEEKEIRDGEENEIEHILGEGKENGSSPKRKPTRVRQRKKNKTKQVTKENSIDFNMTRGIDKEGEIKKKVEVETKESSSNEKHSKAASLWKKSTMKALPWTDMCSKLRQRIADENEKQMDLLETIRRLRGISKDEFYKDIESESSDSEPEQEPLEDSRNMETTPEPEHEPIPPINEDETEEIHEEVKDEKEEEFSESDETPKLPVVFVEKKDEEVRQKPSNKRVIPRIDTRWPVGHKFHTKPAEQKYLSFYLKPINHKLSNSNISIHNLPRTAKEIKEYLQWREKLLEIAYLNEFSHLRKMSLMTFTMPLPGIEQESFSASSNPITNRSSSRSTNSTLRNNRQNVAFQQHSYLTLNKSNGTLHKSTTPPRRQKKQRKKPRNSDILYVNPYLNSKGVGHRKQHKSKDKKVKHEVHSGRDVHYELPVENELETLMSRIDEDSYQGKYENRNKSQSTDSAINEPSFNSDDEESDVIRTTIGSLSVEEGQMEESQLNRTQGGNTYFPREGTNAKSQRKKVGSKGGDFLQAAQHLRTGRYRYLHPLNPKPGLQQVDRGTRLYRKANIN